ncbi:MAG: urea carboxylase [Hyphomicrobium sp.]|jgi:urea carboxylase
MFQKVLIANRGAIACRVIRTLDRLGIASVAVYSEADRYSLHVRQATEAVLIGPPPAAKSYLDQDAILKAALETGAEAIHPGYGFLSENPGFAEACASAGIVFIGPRPEHMRAFGLKHTARELAGKAGVPLAPGSGLVHSVAEAESEAARIGYPVMLKSTAGGGGIGLQLIRNEDELAPMYERVERLAQNNFKDAGIFIEKYVERGRHIEVQIFGDGRGKVVALGERDCSAQRRNQKVVEETPAPNLPDATRKELWETAARLGESVCYANAGTVEFLYDTDSGAFYFLEVNTRLQVEHGVTEEVTGVDLVEWMIREAAGELPIISQEFIRPKGASIQVRLYAEDPARDFRPSSGVLTNVRWPADARIETWVESGTEISPYYDPMIAKIITTGTTREEALARLQSSLGATEAAGIESNLAYLRELIGSEVFASGKVTTRTLDSFAYHPRSIEVLSPGTLTTVQDWPGRLGLWDVGVPPSGPMDARSLRLANRLVGNSPDAAALEITLAGPKIRFNTNATLCLTGAEMAATLDGKQIPFWTTFDVMAGETLSVGTVKGAGARAYLAVRGGIDVPAYLGSKATFQLGKFGGHGGRALLTGDVLHIGKCAIEAPVHGSEVAAEILPAMTHTWEIGVLYGPHGAPDFFTESYIESFFAANWEVHYNSNRTGVRLIGPKPEWARTDGGEAGLHPSNLHDNAYAIGTIDFTGDMPIILGPDGPSLGGFVCPATIVAAELWKIGQLRPGDKVRFKRLTPDAARIAEDHLENMIATLSPPRDDIQSALTQTGSDDCIVGEVPAEPGKPRVLYRRAGDKYMLVEYGPLALDLELRFRVHGLMTALRKRALPGISDLTPGVRSLQIHYESRVLPLDTLIAALREIDADLDNADDITVPGRIVRLPLAWNDTTTQQAIDKYVQSVRPDAPWCPSNIEFIRRMNGLDSIADVQRILFEASYLVLGLGDVYLGAPLATPVDPRHRLVTTKYNPARTWTAENSVGIGGAYMCVYGMEGPGGYQLVGRTCQMWNTYRATTDFEPGKPWLLRFFDQVRFYPVTPGELLKIREDLVDGRFTLDIEETTFSLADYREFLATNAAEIEAFKDRQHAAFEAERHRWKASDQAASETGAETGKEASATDEIPVGSLAVQSPVPGNIWRIETKEGASVKSGDVLVIVESMKMEMVVTAPHDGIVRELRCAEGRAVTLGQTLVVMTETEVEAAE